MKTHKRKTAGIYLLLNENKTIVYVGQSHDIFKRIAAHNTKDWTYFEYEEIIDPDERGTVESKLIKQYAPKYNKENRKVVFPEYFNRVKRSVRWEFLRKTEKAFGKLDPFLADDYEFTYIQNTE